MRFTNTFSLIALYSLFVTANGAVMNSQLSDALAHLEAVKAKVMSIVHAREAAAEPATVASDVLKIVSDGTTMGSDIAKLVADMQSNPKAMSQPNAAAITSDALKIASDVTTLVSDISKLAADASPATKPKSAADN